MLQITAKKQATPKEKTTEAKLLSQFLVGDVKTGTLNHLTNMTGLQKSKDFMLPKYLAFDQDMVDLSCRTSVCEFQMLLLLLF